MRFLKQWLPVVVWASVILIAANDNFSSDSTGGLLDRLLGFRVHPAVNFTIRKTAHLVEYAILAMLVWRADKRMLVVLGIAIFVAIVDETRQGLWTTARSGSPWDVVLDTAGAWLAYVLVERRASARRPRSAG